MDFYAKLEAGLLALLFLSLYLNRANWRMLVVSIIVAAGIFAPIPYTDNYQAWYLLCALTEISTGVLVLVARAPCSLFVFCQSLGMVVIHLIGVIVGPQPGWGPYRVIVPILEVAQLLTCVALSAPVVRKFRQLI